MANIGCLYQLAIYHIEEGSEVESRAFRRGVRGCCRRRNCCDICVMHLSMPVRSVVACIEDTEKDAGVFIYRNPKRICRLLLDHGQLLVPRGRLSLNLWGGMKKWAVAF